MPKDVEKFKIGKTYETIFGTLVKVHDYSKDSQILYQDVLGNLRKIHRENFVYQKQGIPKEYKGGSNEKRC